MLVKKLNDLPKLNEIPDIISLDFETFDNMEIVGFSFAFLHNNKIKSFYCPINHLELTYNYDEYGFKNLPKKEILKYLRELVADRKLVMHNASFDIEVMDVNKIEYDFNKIEDTMLMHYTLDTERLHGLKAIMKNEYGKEVITYDEVVTKDITEFFKYADNDAKYTLFLYYDLLKKFEKLPKSYNLYKNYEIPFIKVLNSLNYKDNKIAIDYELLKKYNQLLNKEIEIVEFLLREKLGNINFNSTKQLGEVLIKNGYKIEATEKGNPSLSEESLIRLKKKYGGLILDLILYYRSLRKIYTTYIFPYFEKVVKENDEYYLSGYSFSNIGTRTGRLSSKNPNLQNQPRDVVLLRCSFLTFLQNKNYKVKRIFFNDNELDKFLEKNNNDNIKKIKEKYSIDIRKLFIARKNYKFIGADFSQIELRMAAHLSGDTMMINAFNNNIDIHQQTAEEVNKLLKSKFTRQQAKPVNFGVLYGLYYNSLAEQTGLKLSEAKKLIETWWRVYRGIKMYVRKLHANARKTGYVETILGRRRNMIELGINDFENFRRLKYAENSCVSHAISGSSADLIKIAMINIYNKYSEFYDKDVKIKIQIHDELLIEVPEEKANEYLELIKYEMVNALKLNVPIEVDARIGNNWREVH